MKSSACIEAAARGAALRLLVVVLLSLVAAAAISLARAREARADHAASCLVERVIDGDTFVCTGGTRVRLLQINAPEMSDPGGPWAGAALRFLIDDRVARLEFDEVVLDRYGRHLAAPHVTGTDGVEYNISILMVYAGLARAAYYGDNARYLDWARAAETWARAACWNMWAARNPWAAESGCV